MTSVTQAAQVSPERIFNTLNAYQETAALKAAIELDVFTAIGEGNETARAIAERCGASQRGVRILCDYLTVIGYLTKEGERYRLAADAAMFLDKRSPACMASAIQFLGSPMLTDNFKDLAAVVRKGGTIDDQGMTAAEHPVWVDFAKAMAPMMRMPAEQIAGLLDARAGNAWRVLDIAAGHGMFGITVAKHNPKAEIVAVDWAPVLEVAKANAQSGGVASRYRTIAGSALEVEFGTGYDIVLLTNILHQFDVPTCERLLRKVHGALKAGGRAATLEFVPNEDRVTPPAAAKFSLTMLGATPQGDAYTFSELQKMFRNAGFSSSSLHPIPASPHQVVISVK
jgi:ubiquinone/menaquinone biosynthesis C-methylase UbiE